MTVCVAAMSRGVIFGASDRKLTVGDIEYEPEASKVYPITSSIAVMFSGDASFHREVVESTHRSISAIVDRDPNAWIDVRLVVDWYVFHRNELKAKAAEAALLAPLRLNTNTFLAQQKNMDPDVAAQLTREIINFSVPDVDCLVSGVDTKGAHIYTITASGKVVCHNATGFAAIGSGYWHAESELMSAGHHTDRSFSQTASVVYRAKRRAEVSPGVGPETDLFMISGLGAYGPVGSDICEKLGELWKTMLASEQQARNTLHAELNTYVSQDRSAPAQPQEVTDPAATAETEAATGTAAA